MLLPPETLASKAAEAITGLPAGRNLIALAGPPGSGKSTVADHIATALRAKGRKVAIVPMDGFHLDNRLLEERGLGSRKGAPDTFDVVGFTHLVSRIASGEQNIVYPVFDRHRDIAIAGAVALPEGAQDIIFEGNYLLLSHPDWTSLQQHWSLTLFVSAPRDVLRDRLMTRWRKEGLSEQICQAKVTENDMPNVDLVLRQSRDADLTLTD